MHFTRKCAFHTGKKQNTFTQKLKVDKHIGIKNVDLAPVIHSTERILTCGGSA